MISYAKLLNNQYLCKVSGLGDKTQSDLPTELIIVFDVSASMGNNVSSIHKLLKSAIANNKIQSTSIITFGERSSFDKFNSNTIDKWSCPKLQDSTMLYDGINKLFNYVNSNGHRTLYQILVISDGDVHDLKHVLDYANTISDNPSNLTKNHLLQVSAIRIGSGGDTRALTCFYIFHNHPLCTQQIIDVPPFGNVAELDRALNNIFDSFSHGQHTYTNTIKSTIPNIKRMPFDSDFTHELEINNGEFFICTDLDTDFTIDSRSVVLTESIIRDDELLPYLKQIEQKIRNIKILGNNQMLKSVGPFLTSINEMLKQNVPMPVEKLSHMATIRRAAAKAQGTIINTILQLVNLEDVHKLNSQQQAQFLRQIDDSVASGRRLAKRSNEKSDDILSTFATGVQHILAVYTHSENLSTDPVSFLSIATSKDILNEALVEIKPNVEIFNLEDLLQCFGQVGICFRSKIGNYPDPWQFNVAQVYNCYLSQQDLYTAHMSGTQLKVPGTADIITGVDVTYSVDSYINNRTVNGIHCSIAMRKIASVITNDDIAMKTAVLYQLINQVVSAPSEIAITNIWNSIDVLKKIIKPKIGCIFDKQVISALYTANMAAYFTGDLDISSINKIIALCLVIRPEKPIDLVTLARALVSLDAYYHIKSIENIQRSEIISQVLEIDIGEYRTVCAEPFDPEPATIVFCDTYNPANLTKSVSKYHNKYRKIAHFIHFIEAFYKSTSITDLTNNLNTPFNMHKIYGIETDVDINLYLAANTLQALISAKLEHRVDLVERKFLLQAIFTADEINTYIKSVVRKHYVDDYQKQLATKKRLEVERATIVQIDQLIWSCDMDEFATKLDQYICQRDSEKYASLVDKLIETADIPLLQEKIWVILLCRIPDSDTVVWNRGNICKQKDLDQFEKIWLNDSIGQITWKKLADEWLNLKGMYICNRYRDGLANRHGHANVCPFSDTDKKGYYSAKHYNMVNRRNPLSADDFDS